MEKNIADKIRKLRLEKGLSGQGAANNKEVLAFSVIASGAKQSSRKRYIFWIASAEASQWRMERIASAKAFAQ